MKTLNKKFIHIGLVRYADKYHPSNEQSEKRWIQLMQKAGHTSHCVDPKCNLEKEFPRTFRLQVARLARSLGYELHFFEKGLGR